MSDQNLGTFLGVKSVGHPEEAERGTARERREVRNQGCTQFGAEMGAGIVLALSWHCTGALLVLYRYCSGTAPVLWCCTDTILVLCLYCANTSVLRSSTGTTLVLDWYWYCTMVLYSGALLVTYWFCTSAAPVPYNHCPGIVPMLLWVCAGTVLVLYWYFPGAALGVCLRCIRTILILHWYCTGTVWVLWWCSTGTSEVPVHHQYTARTLRITCRCKTSATQVTHTHTHCQHNAEPRPNPSPAPTPDSALLPGDHAADLRWTPRELTPRRFPRKRCDHTSAHTHSHPRNLEHRTVNIERASPSHASSSSYSSSNSSTCSCFCPSSPFPPLSCFLLAACPSLSAAENRLRYRHTSTAPLTTMPCVTGVLSTHCQRMRGQPCLTIFTHTRSVSGHKCMFVHARRWDECVFTHKEWAYGFREAPPNCVSSCALDWVSQVMCYDV